MAHSIRLVLLVQLSLPMNGNITMSIGLVHWSERFSQVFSIGKEKIVSRKLIGQSRVFDVELFGPIMIVVCLLNVQKQQQTLVKHKRKMFVVFSSSSSFPCPHPSEISSHKHVFFSSCICVVNTNWI